MQPKLKAQLQSISQKVSKAEKLAGKQIRHALKSTQSFRTQQMKNIQDLVKHARTLKNTKLAKQADQMRKDFETKAVEGLDLLLTKIHIPTRKELERLSKKVAALQKQLDDSKKTKRS
ncbi:MAG: hypothetical protein J0L93_09835 [Deltaproteobacteria bacterium]|nr:hypothetical protein [Deltaproteobacteria bacterium]